MRALFICDSRVEPRGRALVVLTRALLRAPLLPSLRANDDGTAPPPQSSPCSVHDYGDLPNMTALALVAATTRGAVVLGEFSFTAADSNVPNTHGARANHPCTTQTQRTAMYAAYARTLITAPFMIGYGWWCVFMARGWRSSRASSL